MEGQENKELSKKIKYKRWTQRVIILLAIIAAVSAALRFTLEDKDAKLPDGQQSGSKGTPVTVTMEIRCDTLSDDLSKLERPELADYIPEDGTILPPTEYRGTTENTVFDVMNTLCRNNNIHLEFSYTPVYESYYIEGINYIYEFDGGPSSGWMYCVNDCFPNYGSSACYLKDGDVIVWHYTCEGYGEDLGVTFMEE